MSVVAGILRNDNDEVLIAERLGDGPFHGMWEFPGGKIADSEDALDALSRELAEEIGITVLESRFFMRLQHDYPDRSVGIDFYFVDRWSDEPRGIEGQGLRWVAIGELEHANLLPADVPVIEALKTA